METMVHTHHKQACDLSNSLSFINNANAGTVVLIPIMLVLPELDTDSKGYRYFMPPSCTAGPLYMDPQGRTYMQPLNEYFLEIDALFRSSSQTTICKASARYKINVTTAPRISPPTYSPFPMVATPASCTSEIRHTIFSKAFAQISLSIAEPRPILGHSKGCCQTVGKLQISWNTLDALSIESASWQRPLTIKYYLQENVFSCTRVVSDNKNVECAGKTRSRTKTARLGTLEVRLNELDSVRRATCENPARYYSGIVAIPIQIDEAITPTFSHLLASCDHALLVKAQIQGMRHREMSLKVPMRIYSTSGIPGVVDAANNAYTNKVLALEEVSE